MLDEYKIIACFPLDDYKVDLTFSDGKQGVVDLKYLVGRGVFACWNDYDEFKKVSIDPFTKTICWGEEIDLDPVNLREKIS